MDYLKSLLILIVLSSFMACGDDDATPELQIPETYSFQRDGASTVSFSGQTTRINMGEEFISALKDFDTSEEQLLEMFTNEKADGSDANPFTESSLNESTKSIRSKVAASIDLFSANTVDAAAIKANFENWINGQVNEIFPNKNEIATAGQAGQIADGTSTRYINAKGLEYNQMVTKSLIGALMTDQALNNYLGTAVLDAADNQALNDAGTVEEDKNYTTMEHKWDEAFGYLYGASADETNPNATIGSDDSFLNKYLGRVDGDSDFSGIATDIFEAFKTGRAAIVAGEYEIRDEQAAIIRENISKVVAVRAVYYLQQGKNDISNGNMGSAFHNLSEGLGFVYSLQFTRLPNASQSYFSKTEVNTFIDSLLNDNANGFWDLTPETLDSISEAIAAKFDFTVTEAGE